MSTERQKKLSTARAFGRITDKSPEYKCYEDLKDIFGIYDEGIVLSMREFLADLLKKIEGKSDESSGRTLVDKLFSSRYVAPYGYVTLLTDYLCSKCLHSDDAYLLKRIGTTTQLFEYTWPLEDHLKELGCT